MDVLISVAKDKVPCNALEVLAVNPSKAKWVHRIGRLHPHIDAVKTCENSERQFLRVNLTKN